MYLSDIDKPWTCSGEDTGQLRIMYHNGGIMDNQGPNKYNYNNGNNAAMEAITAVTAAETTEETGITVAVRESWHLS